MNETLDDEVVIVRLRNALDELTAPGNELVTLRTRSTMTPARWMAVAAASVLVVGAVAAVAVNLNARPQSESSPPTSPVTSPLVTSAPIVAPFFTLISPDLLPGEVVQEQCCRQDPHLVMAWSNGDAVLTLGRVLDAVGEPAQVFLSYGLTSDEEAALVSQVVPGSGLPYLLPVEGWTLVALGSTAGTDRLVQLYTPLNNDPVSSYMPTVTISVGEYRGELELVALSPDSEEVTVAGYDGWKVVDAGGRVTVFWDVGDGNWATMVIDAKLADRTDGLIAAVVEVDAT